MIKEAAVLVQFKSNENSEAAISLKEHGQQFHVLQLARYVEALSSSVAIIDCTIVLPSLKGKGRANQEQEDTDNVTWINLGLWPGAFLTNLKRMLRIKAAMWRIGFLFS
ncbi:hypothetical protein OIU84_003779 [Salix udensis]|uniref:Uncharacterized protein n=1 Tax=Salix udensis TaxID=889485 RepID=A0AAD6K0L2_9ROSI|nr:hypothetical protein OIU84_003779 [Salix udensis]